jgi:hypothetical protein
MPEILSFFLDPYLYSVEELSFILVLVFVLTFFDEMPEKGGFREELSFR